MTIDFLFVYNNLDSYKWHTRLDHIGPERMARLVRECLITI